MSENNKAPMIKLAGRRIGELVPAIPKEKTGRGKKTPRDSGTFPESQRLSEFRLLAGATMAPISGDYKTVIIDPPWPIEKVERTERPLQAAIDTSLD
jgi:hypothetical protein